MENKTINLSLVKEVAEALEELKDQMVFVGGATSAYIPMIQLRER